MLTGMPGAGAEAFSRRYLFPTLPALLRRFPRIRLDNRVYEVARAQYTLLIDKHYARLDEFLQEYPSRVEGEMAFHKYLVSEAVQLALAQNGR